MCWDCEYNTKGDPYKMFTQGGVDVDDFDDEISYRHPTRKKKSKAVKSRPGCPENDYKSHVYVWTTELERDSLFYRHFGFHSKEREVCAGCGKMRGSRNSEKYEKRKAKEYAKLYGTEFSVKRGEPISRRSRYAKPSYSWWRWEDEIEDYRLYRREYIAKHGWNNLVYSL